MQKHEITMNELPQSIIVYIQKQYKDYTIDEAEKIEKSGVVFYQVELEAKGRKDLHLVFSADGREDRSIGYWD
jgi:hypothetical protein